MLEWEEHVFLGLKALYRRIVARPHERAAAGARVRLPEVRAPLFLLGQMIAGRSVALFETPNAVLCDRERIFLPPELAVAGSREANISVYQVKTVVAALALRRGGPYPADRPLAEILREEVAALPGLPQRLAEAQRALGARDLWELLGRPAPSRVEARSRPRPVATAPAPETAPNAMTEIEGKGQTGVTVAEGGDDQPVESEMPMHTLEKVETIEEYTGLDRKTDADDELDEHGEALRSVEMTHVIRSRERPRSIYRSDIVLDGLCFDLDDGAGSGGIPYPEWNSRARAYRADWCRVYETRQQVADVTWLAATERRHRALVLDLKKKFSAIANEWLRRKRQPFGPDFDLDAVVDGEVARHAGQSPGELCYVDRRRSLHDVAALILMDQSFSTDAWIDDARVLDTIRDTIFCVGEVLEDFVERFAVAAFSSNTRRQCAYHRIKDFAEPWHGTRARLGGIEARGYTRIGPALRHAQEQLVRESAARKVLLLVTDGRPCDYDRYEGDYGIQDVKKAIETGKRHGILIHAFAVDRQAREHFPRMFTQHHYHIVANPRVLVQSMCALFVRLETG